MIILSLAGFSPIALACYGSSFNRTLAIDRIASGGTVWDRAIATHWDPRHQFACWLEGLVLPESSRLVTDDVELGQLAATDRFATAITVPHDTAQVADQLEDTRLARLIAIASETLSEDQLTWIHSDFLTQFWDAPRWLIDDDEFDGDDDWAEPEEYDDPGDLPIRQETRVPTLVQHGDVPEVTMQPGDDPDWVMTWMRTYACQIRLVDAMVGVLNDLAGKRPLILTGSSGFALGQNGTIGHRSGPVRTCHLHVPLITSVGSGIRGREVFGIDYLPRLVSSFLTDPERPPLSPEDYRGNDPVSDASQASVVMTQQDQSCCAVTTHQWFYAKDGALFLKPDDTCDVNDVSRLRPDVADELAARLANSK